MSKSIFMELKLSYIYQSYITEESISKQERSNLKTALFKYTLPSLGFIMPKRSANRLHPGDIQLAIAFCSDIYLDADLGKKLVKAQENYFEKITPPSHTVRHNRRVLKNFLNYLDRSIKQNDLPLKEKKQYQPGIIMVDDLSHIENSKVKKAQKAKIALSFNHEDYFKSNKPMAVGGRKDITPVSSIKDVDVIKCELNRIQSEIDSYKKFLTNSGMSISSITGMIRCLKALLGWQCIQTKDLTEVGIEKLIIKYNIYPKKIYDSSLSKQENYVNYMVEKAEAIDKGKEYAKQTINWITNFFEEYKVNNKKTKTSYISLLVSLAKYIYKDITDKEENINYEDISVIKRLRVLQNKVPEDNKKIQIELPSWETVIKILYELKRSADLSYHPNGSIIRKIQKGKRLQRFLIFAFFTLVPPSRLRVVNELKLGKTLKYGSYVNDVLVPFDSKKRTPLCEASFYIHLQPEDYKTGKIYGEWLGKFPNFKFPDGTYFYDYLNLWINQYREIVLDGHEDHGYLFMGGTLKKPQSHLGAFIKTVFKSTIGVKVSPHKLRTIYRTYLADIGADQQTIESSAFWMRHSPEMARNIYTRQTLDNKLAPGAEAILRINEKLMAS